MSELEIEVEAIEPSDDPVERAVGAFILRNAETIASWEGELTQEAYESGDLSGWLPGYNSGVYVVGEYHDGCHESCEGVLTPGGYRTCTPRVKIGRAKNMYARLACIRCGGSRDLEVLALMPFEDAARFEHQLHRIFSPYRIKAGHRTEWFWHSEALDTLVCEAVSFGAEYDGRPR